MSDNTFPGFPHDYKDRKFWSYPKIMDRYWHTLSGSEQKVLDFILRHTLGFNKLSDKMALSQFANGVRKFDTGTGLSKKQIVRALRRLEEYGYLKIGKTRGKTNEYSLVINYSEVGTESNSTRDTLVPSGRDKTEQLTGDNSIHTIKDITVKNSINNIYSFYKDRILPGVILTRRAEQNIAKMLLKFSPEELVMSLYNFSQDEWQMDKNANRGLVWFFQNDERVSRFLQVYTPEELLKDMESPDIFPEKVHLEFREMLERYCT